MTLKGKSAKSSVVRIDGGHCKNNECIWMRAGLVKFRLCDNAFDCGSCPFDTGMQKKMKKRSDPSQRAGKSQLGEALFLRYRKEELPCRHYLSGRIEVMKQCSNNYECNHCEYDQWLDAFDERDQTTVPVKLSIKEDSK